MAQPSTPNQLLDHLKQNLTANQIDLTKGFLLAVSGGVDSMSLLALFTALRDEGLLTFDVMHINHQLRPDAIADQRLVIDYCEAHDIDLAVRIWRHDELTAGIEAQARAFRYANFAEYLENHHYRYLVTAHHLEDVSETVLMRLIQGHQLRAIQSMRETSPLYNYRQATVYRPLLGIEKNALYDLVTEWQIPFREDTSNNDLQFTRNRMRQKWLPELQTEDPNVIAHLFDFSRELQATLSVLDRQFSTWWQDAVTLIDEQHWLIDRRALPVLTPQELALFIHYCLNRIDNETFQSFGRKGQQALAAFLQSDTPQGEWALPGDYILRKEYQSIIISHLTATVSAKRPQLALTISDSKGEEGHPIPPEYSRETVVLRERHPGDRVRLANDHHQKVTRYLINRKVPQAVRDRLQVIVVGEQEVLGLLDSKTGELIYSYPTQTDETKIFWYLRNVSEKGDF